LDSIEELLDLIRLALSLFHNNVTSMEVSQVMAV